jgi:two-component system, OmpR family, heavy metal sensor histidine kinase CusS
VNFDQTPRGRSTPSLGRRLSTWLALQGFATALAVSATVYGVNYWLLALRQQEELNLKADVVRLALTETAATADAEGLRRKLEEFLIGHRDMALRVMGPAGQILFDSAQGKTSSPPPQRVQRATLQSAWPTSSSRFVSVDLLLDVTRDDLLLRRLGWTLLAASLAGAVLVSATGLLLVRRGLRPVEALAQQIDAVALDRVGLRLDGSAQPLELQPLVERFNALLARVEQAYTQLESFNADVAHEMRTPLTTLIGSSELALNARRSPGELRDVIASNLEDLRRLGGIVNDMLFLSRADRGARARRAETASLARSLAEVVDYYDAALAERDLALVCEGDARVAVDLALMKRAVANLISNAVRYADAGSTVYLRIDVIGQLLRVAVENRGGRIANEHLPRLFDRFYRVERSRRAGSAHHGLGLAIVSAIARMHGGKPFATSTAGTTAIGIELPASAPPDGRTMTSGDASNQSDFGRP